MLRNFINQFMVQHLNNFISLKENTSLCSLRSFDINRWNPDYTNALHREFYYLKYAFAYMVEYFFAYNEILSKKWLSDSTSINTLSIGCGAMLDLVGFKFALDKNGLRNGAHAYIGVDKVHWQCSETQLISQCSYIIEDIENYRLGVSGQPISIITFPKSISDISNDKIQKFVHTLEKNNLSHRLCVINAKRGKSKTDIDDAHIFVTALERRLGYKLQKITPLKGVEDVYFEAFFKPKLLFMPNIVKELKNTAYSCSMCDCEHSAHCADIVGRSPIRYSHHMNPDIYYLERSA